MARRKVAQRLLWRARSYFRPPAANEDYQRSRAVSQSTSRGRFGRVTLSLGLLVAALAAGSYFSFVHDISATIEGGNDELERQVAAQTESLLGSGLKRFKPLIDERALAEAIERSAGNLHEIEVNLPVLSGRLGVTGSLRQAVAYSNAPEGGVVLVDQLGQPFMVENAVKSAKSLPKIVDTSPLAADAAEDLSYPAATVVFITDLDRLLRENNLAAGPIVVEVSDQPRQVTWQPTDKAYGVKFNSGRDPLDQVNEYKQILAYLKARSQAPGQYIDLRVDDTAYYR